MADIFERHEQARREGWLIGGVWKSASIDEVPQIRLGQWQVFRVKNSGNIHFCGYNLTEGGGKVSSAVVEFDPATLRGRTQSGRVYELERDARGWNSDASYVLGVWLSILKLTEADIEYITELPRVG